MSHRFSPPLQYARTADGVSIAFLTVGEGPTIVFASNIWGDAHEYRHLQWHYARGIANGLAAAGWRVVLYDVRGMGASDRPPVDWSLDGRVLDLEAVVARVGAEEFALVAVDIGAPTAMAYAARHPERVTRLVLLSPWVSGAEMFDLPDLKVAASAMMNGTREWQVFTTVLANVACGFQDAARSRELAASMQLSSAAEGLAEYYRTTAEMDLASLLPRVNVPTLVVHFPTFPFGSRELCQQVAKGIRDAQLAVVEESSIGGPMHDGSVRAIDSFVRGGTVAAPLQSRSPSPTGGALTERETEVLGRLAAGLANKEIATALGISVPTVERHLANLYPKIGARGRVDATTYALRHGLVKPRG
jgi:pimeloyl-ACP methyl ester carboxylesterase/DNA-binding CsgD family transcriptional regulator